MYNNVFKRVEEKYLITTSEKELLLEKIKKHIQKDEYFESTICNIYYDNKEQELIINSLEKPIYKDKVRIRSYGIPTLEDEIFLEIKSKYKGIVGKRRIKMKLKEFYNYIENNKFKDNQIMKELDYLFKYYNLLPNMYIAYDRQCYKGVEDQKLRITFDHNLRSRRDNLKLELGDYGDKYLDDDLYIMEIKTLVSIPLWLVKELSDLKIYPKSFSKYGIRYSQEIKEMEIC